MGYTNRHMRYMFRLLSKRAVLYTEMVSDAAICRKDGVGLERFMKYNKEVEHPVVLQLGGASVEGMKAAVEKVTRFGYDEININCGCPSNKVSGHGFGASLMLERELVASMCKAVAHASGGVPITVKCRLGVDDMDSYEFLREFIHTVGQDGLVSHFIVHARKAILNQKFSPKQNRNIPPLNYERVYQLVNDFPEYKFTLNGGLNTYEQIAQCFERGVHGVMVGRQVNEDPYYWSKVDSKLFGDVDPGLSREEVVKEYALYARSVVSEHRLLKGSLRKEPAMGIHTLLKPIQRMFAGKPGSRHFRRELYSNVCIGNLPVEEVILKSLDALSDYEDS